VSRSYILGSKSSRQGSEVIQRGVGVSMVIVDIVFLLLPIRTLLSSFNPSRQKKKGGGSVKKEMGKG
jgi:hypothetical protein